MAELNVGDRVAVSNALGTIRAKGPKRPEKQANCSGSEGTNANRPGSSSEDDTLLVEWDDMTRGDLACECERLNKLRETELRIVRHFRELRGASLDQGEISAILEDRFKTARSCRPCSLVPRASVDARSTFEAEFESKYLRRPESIEVIEMEDSDRKYEFVGVDQACSFFSDPKKLFTVSLSGCGIAAPGNVDFFPSCTELYLADNLLASSQINRMLPCFPRLAVLDVSRNKLDAPIRAPSASTLIMNGSFTEFEGVLASLDGCPRASDLVLADNLISEVGFAGTSYPLVRSLSLSGNYLHSWSSVFSLFRLFPNLKKLILQNNFISGLDLYPHQGPSFPGLTELDLSHNLIEDAEALVKISQTFPNLTRLKINSNPIVLEPTRHTAQLGASANKNKQNMSDILRMLILVTFPNLLVLNGTTVTLEEKTNSQRYMSYLERANAAPESESRPVPQASGRVRVLLVPDGDAESFAFEPVEKRLPESTTISDLKLLCSRLFRMNLKDIKLAYNSKKMPLCEDLDDESADLCRYGISDGYEIRVQNKNLKL